MYNAVVAVNMAVGKMRPVCLHLVCVAYV